MSTLLAPDESLLPVHDAVTDALARVEARFQAQLASDLPPVSRLVEHVEQFRGKMLRPTLVMACGLAAESPSARAEGVAEARGGRGRGRSYSDLLSDEHVTVAAVCELIHMATLVHDDVLDEAELRRNGKTVNRLHGNEAAVILGDYLIASAYHLCSTLDAQRTALLVGHVSMVMCTGELLQLHHRDDFSLDEPTYFEIIDRKTAALIGLACELGARASGASDDLARRFCLFGRRLGMAFQIQDDLLDLTGDERIVGKPMGQDIGKGKVTLPIIHHLERVDPMARGRSLVQLEAATRAFDDAHAGHASDLDRPRTELVKRLESTGSIDYARQVARRLVDDARDAIARLPDAPPTRLLHAMADAVVNRAY